MPDPTDSTPESTPDPPLEATDLEPLMAAAFGPGEAPDGESGGRSVLESLGARLGSSPKILLTESPEGGDSPLLRASPPELRALSRGRGDYQTLGEIARGGMGVVYKGHDPDLGRDVAMKVLHEELASDPVVLQRFVEEAQIGGQLQHPGIVPVYELGLMADDRPYFTMKLVKGRTLATLLDERERPSTDRRRFIGIFESICQTVAYAHSRDVIHRDLKPSNVMVGAFGEVQVVDWGLAKVLRRGGGEAGDDARAARRTKVSVIETVRSGSSSTGTDSVSGSILGTPAYMAPEQARGEVEDLDARCDVFTLGGILCEILTGQAPYPGAKRFALSQAAASDQEQVRRRLAGCDADGELLELVRDCLAAEPADRPRHAGVVAQRIGAYLASVEDRARASQIEAAEARVRAADERKARRLTVGLAASLLVTSVALGGGWLWLEDRRAEEETRLREAAFQATAALQEASLHRGQGDWATAQTAVERARAFLDAGVADVDLERSLEVEARAVRTGRARARAEADRKARVAAFLDTLTDIRSDLGQDESGGSAFRMQLYERTFVDFGIDLEFLTDGEAVDAIRETGREVEIAEALDDWGTTSPKNGKPSAVQGERLLRISLALDPDPIRTQLREAILARDDGAIYALADGGEYLDAPPVTSIVLASSLGTCREPKGRLVSVLRKAARRYPDEFRVQTYLGCLLAFGGKGRPPRPAEGLPYLRAALALQPDSPWVLGRLGRAYRKFGDFEEAVWYLRRSLAVGEEHCSAHQNLGLALLDLGDFEGALESLGKALELHRSSTHLNQLALAQIAAGESAGAIESVRGALAMDPKDGLLWNNLSWYLSTAPDPGDRDSQEALRAAERALELRPGDGNAFNTLGVARYRAGDLEGCLQALGRSIELSDGAGLAVDHFFLAMAHFRLGDEAAAQSSYDSAVQWMEEQEPPPADRDELARFRAEAEEVLGIEGR